MRLASIVSVITVLQLTALFSLMWVGQISFASPAVLVVDDDGMASPTDCDAGVPAYASIQAAIDAASPGDEIIVCPGTYSEQVTIDKSGLRVRSFDGSALDGTPDTVIQPGELSPAGVQIKADGVVFQGFYIKDTTTGHDHAHRGIFVQGDNNVILNNKVEGRGVCPPFDTGILVRGGGVGDGVATNNLIENNEVANTCDGIVTVSVDTSNAAAYTTIIRNTVKNNLNIGIAADRTPSTLVSFNKVTSNKIGLKYHSDSEKGLPATGTKFRCNDVYGNNQYDAENIAKDSSTMDAEYNWWGSTGGPDTGKISGNVDYEPWLTSPSEESCPSTGRMTGGGVIVYNMITAHFGFELHCSIEKKPNNLEINWRNGEGKTFIFHLMKMDSASCFFDMHRGSGEGRLKIGSNLWKPATIVWTFVDDGEPGAGKDFLNVEITIDSTSYVILGKIDGGNIQAHPDDP
ncbi:MAG: right-handed parallel beta-helix repeat-containing protein [Candidatus Caldarchaeum sp.]